MAQAPRLAGTGREQPVVVPSSNCETSGLAAIDQRAFHPGETFDEGGAAAAEVEAHVGTGAGAEEPAVGYTDSVFFKVGGGILEFERLHVEPREISGLDRRLDAHTGQLAGDEAEQEIATTPQIIKQRATPWRAMAVSRLAGGEAEIGDLRHDAGRGAGKL